MSTIKVSLWLRRHNIDGSRNRWLVDSTMELAVAHFKPEKRAGRTHLLQLQDSQLAAATATLAHLAVKDDLASYMYCDLDNFKQVNDRIGHNEGHRVIKELGRVIDDACKGSAVPLHLNGDEFAVICACSNHTDALVLAREIQLAAASHDYGIDGISLGVTIGVAFVTRESSWSLEDIGKRAEDSTKLPGENGMKGEKRRGRINVAIDEFGPDSRAMEQETCEQVALCLARTNLGTATPFASLALNLISIVVSQTPPTRVDEVQPLIEDLLSKLQHDWDAQANVACISRSDGPLYGPALAPFDVAIAALHGILRAFAAPGVDIDPSWRISFKCDQSRESCRLTLDKQGSVTIWEIGKGNLEIKRDFGGLFKAQGEIYTQSCTDWLLLKIGHEELMPCSGDLLLDTIVLDDRPVRGGGLPDFWQSALARIVDTVGRHADHFQGLFVWGDSAFAPQTVAKLRQVCDWTKPEVDLSEPLAVKADALLVASKALEGKILFPATTKELIHTILETALPSRKVPTRIHALMEAEPPAVLPFQYVFNEFELELFDGCRVKTLADAYPLVLAICQDKCQGSDNDVRLQDQSGSPFTELVDFKVHIEEPFVDMIPAYMRHEEVTFESYYTHAFEDGGLFEACLSRDDQLNAVVNHVREIIRGATKYATRRAILVIPHEPDNGRVAPLGLTAIRIIPRFSENLCVLHFSYTWRTVEAIVGFPYSIYGSAKYAQHLLDLFTRGMEQPERDRVKLGTLSYMASSLHYFLDPSMRRIGEHITALSAKRIPRNVNSERAI
ncbi:MAG: GGDEF domain-containing protein [Fimbriimonadaceae bacterium]